MSAALFDSCLLNFGLTLISEVHKLGALIVKSFKFMPSVRYDSMLVVSINLLLFGNQIWVAYDFFGVQIAAVWPEEGKAPKVGHLRRRAVVHD